MRFRRLRMRVFGPHRDLDLDLDSDLVLVFGSNESGKSSFRSAVEARLEDWGVRQDLHAVGRDVWSPPGEEELAGELARLVQAASAALVSARN